MARQQAGETKTPIIIALVFFVLTTLTLGVLYYMSFEQIAAAQAAKAEADKTAQAANDLKTDEQSRVLVYRTALGINTQEDWDNLKNLRKDGAARKEHKFLLDEVQKRLGVPGAPGLVDKASKDFVGKGTTPFNVKADDLLRWPWPEGAKMDKEPEKPIVDAVVRTYANQKLATAAAQAETALAVKQRDDYAKAQAQAETSKQGSDALAVAYPKQVQGVQVKADEELKKVRAEYAALTKKYIEDIKERATQAETKDIRIADLEQKLATFTARTAKLEEAIEQREDPFAFDRPHTTVLRRRERSKLVEIGVGSAANVRPGLTFSVQPADTPTRGLQTRMKQRVDRNGKPAFDSSDRPLMEITPKGTVEVVEVLGPNLSVARITSEADETRDPILAGDVLYNSVWRPGAPDHVALFGVFDVDGDGTDDIKQVVRDLAKVGVVVDAYFDLETKKWVGQITPQTIYAIEGYYPSQTGGGGLADAKGAIDQALRDARATAKEKGAKVVKIRDFFPRIGYKVRMDVSPDTINRAFNKYLQTLPPGETGADPMPKN